MRTDSDAAAPLWHTLRERRAMNKRSRSRQRLSADWLSRVQLKSSSLLANYNPPPTHPYILCTGYWPPTNISSPEGLLADISQTSATGIAYPGLTGQGEYIKGNYNGAGYNIVAIAPTFGGLTAPPYGKGSG